jgi:hypothetical protein
MLIINQNANYLITTLKREREREREREIQHICNLYLIIILSAPSGVTRTAGA